MLNNLSSELARVKDWIWSALGLVAIEIKN